MLEQLKDKIGNISKSLEAHHSHVASIAHNLEKLGTDKVNALAQVNFLNGALQAYNDVAALLAGNPLPLVQDVVNLAKDSAEESDKAEVAAADESTN